MPAEITLQSVTDENLNAVLSLTLNPGQEKFVPSPAGILSRAWAHRDENAEVHVICACSKPVGLMLTYDVTEEPACHFLMEMMVDARFQGQGVGLRALKLLIAHISRAPRFDMIELSVDRTNAAAIRLYEKAGFTDSGYTDPDLPQYINMIYKI